MKSKISGKRITELIEKNTKTKEDLRNEYYDCDLLDSELSDLLKYFMDMKAVLQELLALRKSQPKLKE